MSAIDDDAGARAALLGGALLVPYALLKDEVSRTIMDTGASLPGASSWLTAQLFHVTEGALLLLVGVGFLAVVRRAGTTRRPLGTVGYAVWWAGFALVIGFHALEHLAGPRTLPATLDLAVLWGYYVGWGVLLGGHALVGLDALRAGALPGWIPALFVGLAPAGAAVGLAVVALDAFTFAGVQRLFLGATWAAVGYHLWTVRAATPGVDAPAGG